MALFRLLGPHTFTTTKGQAYYETGTELDSSEVVDFHCTALMSALDAEAQTMLEDECQRLRTTGTTTEYGEIPGFGPVQRLPA